MRAIAPLSRPASAGSMPEHFLGGKQSIERRGKARVNRHLHDGLHDLLLREADVQARLDVHLELRLGIAHGRQRGNGRDFAGAQVESGAGINIAERKLQQILREVRGDVRQRLDDPLPRMAIDLRQDPAAAFAAAFLLVDV